jgi:hypothetical protein
MTESAPPPEPAPVPPAPPSTVIRRPGLDPATRRQTVIVAAVIAALFYGSQIVNEALPANAQGQVAVAPGEPVSISADAQITPLSGWVATVHESGNGIRLEKGIVTIDLFTGTFGANARELAGAYLDDVLRPDATQITTSETEVVTTETGTAARFAYQGIFKGIDVPIEGEVTALFVGGHGVVADAWTRQGDLGELLGEIHAMIGTIEVKA